MLGTSELVVSVSQVFNNVNIHIDYIYPYIKKLNAHPGALYESIKHMRLTGRAPDEAPERSGNR
jgi:hypothetical protein